jgi:type IV secretion system protein VirB6
MGLFSIIETGFSNRFNVVLAGYTKIYADKTIFLMKLGTPILVLYYGYSIMSSRGSNATIHEMLFNMVRIAIVFAFVENSEGLLTLTIDFIHELKNGFVQARSIWAFLDDVAAVTQKLSGKVREVDDSTFNIVGIFASLMIWAGSIFVLVSAITVFILAEISLTILTVTSPIFIGCLTYSFTRELFNGWLRSVFSNIITLIFATLVVKIGVDINIEILRQFAAAPQKYSVFTVGSASLTIGVVITALIFISINMAGNIAGVAAISVGQAGAYIQQLSKDVVKNTLGKEIAKDITKTLFKGIGEGVGKYFGRNPKQESTLKTAGQKASFNRIQQTNSGR